ncbi:MULTISPECIES: pyruvate dehydrogenase (acetyl-transferring) E1 component subunit alpha [Haloferax]|uniref:Pyruvate dehydrogenase (Acetyl-transferring) E1 component subunit alpha n=2 Tax=Haloferax TaxID=2251 RepID=A0A6G1Z2B6_9EURY|nr:MULTISPECIES: pyruvate dehydrogenase (acetyl-transferring) E1 component subunit alpha [Haloferax]KAB1188003.1 pyruvate dehydrogenase (acetyl-transferring) E1 component subunit alpha [Haloferax sp. CBA1149]MRW80672.1 pyruvate dehydrogenase (acetyl-transferring) E1 component subunit alpha [Haloferax marinisediminis]
MESQGDVLSRGPDERVQVLDADGSVVAPELVPNLDDETFVSMFRDMRFCRRFDERLISLQRQGRIGTYASLAGQEGSQIGSMYALSDEDVVSYQYREHGAVVARGFPWEYLLYWAGHEAGHEALADRNIFPLNISIAAHLPHAVGVAMAMKYREEPRVTVAHFGDGATSEGDFHEALNFAGVFDVPALFVCNNNQWAISTPRDEQTASRTFAQKADAYGFEGVQVDGMDPLAMYVVTQAAREKALDASGETPRPTLIEAIQYRYGAHTTADDPSVYRDDEEVEQWRQKDPLDRFEAFLRETGRLDDDSIEAMEDDITETLADAIDRMESFDADPNSMFEYAYADQTTAVREQHEEFQRMRAEYGDESFRRE